MEFRAYCYLQVGSNRVRLTSEAVDTEAAADTLFDAMIALPGVTGGDLETHVPGIGWVMGGTTEAESAVLIARRSEQSDDSWDNHCQ